MNTLAQIEALNEAIKILGTARHELASGSKVIWTLTFHAQEHLDRQIRELLNESPKHDGLDGHCQNGCPCLTA